MVITRYKVKGPKLKVAVVADLHGKPTEELMLSYVLRPLVFPSPDDGGKTVCCLYQQNKNRDAKKL